MTRKRIVILLAAVAILASAAFFFLRRRGGDPDIILVTIDTLRADCIGFSGRSKVKTPFLDELASRGIYFENAHAHNVMTLPSHTNILTGLLPYQHGVRDNAGFTLDNKPKSVAAAAKKRTVAAVLRERGYATGAFVAAYPLDAHFGLDADFDVYDDEYRKAGSGSAFDVPERAASEVLSAARAWYDSVSGRKKFLWVHLYEPHAPYEPPSPFREQYADVPYYGEVAAVDDALGRFLGPILEERPETMVILTADHGEGQGEHGEVTHGLFAYEETLHVPLIVYEKGRIEPRREKAFVRHSDIVPTLLARLGIDKPAALTGDSLLHLGSPRDTYFEALWGTLNLGWAPLVGMIHDGHKYIDLPVAELYDLAADPLEKQSLLAENRRMTARIRERLAAAAPNPQANIERSVTPDEAKNLMSLGYLTGTAAAKKTYTADDDPKNLVKYYARLTAAIEHYQKGEWDEAVAVAQKLVDERPEMSMAKDLLAFVLQQTEHGAQAEKKILICISNLNLCLMRIQQENLLRKTGYPPTDGENALLVDYLREKIQLLESENHTLQQRLSDEEMEKKLLVQSNEQAQKETELKERTIAELHNSITRLKREIWKIENAKAPAQLFVFILFILVIVLLIGTV